MDLVQAVNQILSVTIACISIGCTQHAKRYSTSLDILVAATVYCSHVQTICLSVAQRAILGHKSIILSAAAAASK